MLVCSIDHIATGIEALVRQKMGVLLQRHVHLPAARTDKRVTGLHVSRVSGFRQADRLTESRLSAHFRHRDVLVKLLPLVPVPRVGKGLRIAGDGDVVKGRLVGQEWLSRVRLLSGRGRLSHPLLLVLQIRLELDGRIDQLRAAVLHEHAGLAGGPAARLSRPGMSFADLLERAA